MDYEVIKAYNLSELCDQVCAKLRDGWKPQGGISMLMFEDISDRKGYTDTVWAYAQAIIKETQP